MSKTSKGLRTRTRNKLRQKKRIKFKSEMFLKTFDIDQKVIIKPEPSSHKGMPFPKFKGRVGKIIGKRGSSYIVRIEVGKSKKDIISRPEHIEAIKQ